MSYGPTEPLEMNKKASIKWAQLDQQQSINYANYHSPLDKHYTSYLDHSSAAGHNLY